VIVDDLGVPLERHARRDMMRGRFSTFRRKA
jgi:hypothetical protein